MVGQEALPEACEASGRNQKPESNVRGPFSNHHRHPTKASHRTNGRKPFSSNKGPRFFDTNKKISTVSLPRSRARPPRGVSTPNPTARAWPGRRGASRTRTPPDQGASIDPPFSEVIRGVEWTPPPQFYTKKAQFLVGLFTDTHRSTHHHCCVHSDTFFVSLSSCWVGFRWKSSPLQNATPPCPPPFPRRSRTPPPATYSAIPRNLRAMAASIAASPGHLGWTIGP